jgi:cytochrome P450
VLLREATDEDGLDIPDDELKAQIMTFLSAGHETTATGTNWALHALSHNTDAQDKLRAEIKEYFPDGVETAPTADHLNQMEYLECIVKEVLRVYPPVVLAMRVALEDDVLPGGQLIPKDTTLALFIGIAHTQEAVWGDDAHEFKPDRWLQPIDIPNFNHVYMPFLAGPHQCIGLKLALLEIKMLLVCILSELAFTPVQGHVVKKELSITSRPYPHVLVNATLVQ